MFVFSQVIHWSKLSGNSKCMQARTPTKTILGTLSWLPQAKTRVRNISILGYVRIKWRLPYSRLCDNKLRLLRDSLLKSGSGYFNIVVFYRIKVSKSPHVMKSFKNQDKTCVCWYNNNVLSSTNGHKSADRVKVILSLACIAMPANPARVVFTFDTQVVGTRVFNAVLLQFNLDEGFQLKSFLERFERVKLFVLRWYRESRKYRFAVITYSIEFYLFIKEDMEV